MAIPFSSLQSHLKLEIIKKLDLTDFLNFKQSSRESLEISKLIKHRFPYSVPFISFLPELYIDSYGGKRHYFADKILPENVHLVTDKLFCPILKARTTYPDPEIVKFVRDYGTKAKEIVLCVPLDEDSSTEPLEEILKHSGAKRISSYGRSLVSFKFLLLPQLEEVCTYSPIGDEEFLQLRLKKFYLIGTLVTPYGINRFLRNLFSGKQKIESATVETRLFEEFASVVECLSFEEKDFEDPEQRIRNGKEFSISSNDGSRWIVIVHKNAIGNIVKISSDKSFI